MKHAVNTVRRSVALPVLLLRQAQAAAPRQLRGNLNGLVKTALREFARRRTERDLAQAMARMARDPALRSECAAIELSFRPAEEDGLNA